FDTWPMPRPLPPALSALVRPSHSSSVPKALTASTSLDLSPNFSLTIARGLFMMGFLFEGARADSRGKLGGGLLADPPRPGQAMPSGAGRSANPGSGARNFNAK